MLAKDDGQHRALINTYISLIASTLATFIVSAAFDRYDNDFDNHENVLIKTLAMTIYF